MCPRNLTNSKLDLIHISEIYSKSKSAECILNGTIFLHLYFFINYKILDDKFSFGMSKYRKAAIMVAYEYIPTSQPPPQLLELANIFSPLVVYIKYVIAQDVVFPAENTVL